MRELLIDLYLAAPAAIWSSDGRELLISAICCALAWLLLAARS